MRKNNFPKNNQDLQDQEDFVPNPDEGGGYQDEGFVESARTVWEKSRVRNIIITIIILSALFLIPLLINNLMQNRSEEVSLSQVITIVKQEVEEGKAKDNLTVTVIGDTVQLDSKDPKFRKVATLENNSVFSEILDKEGVRLDQLNYRANPPVDIPWDAVINLALLLIVVVAIGILASRLIKNMQSSSNRLMSFGQSKARLLLGKKTGVNFEDVAGSREAKKELWEVVQFLKSPKKYIDMGARIPKGVLLVGPPGSGKTLLARAIAGEAGVPFFHTSGAEFEEMLVGAGASRVRDLFEKAKKVAPSLIFIDEVDAVARKRGTVLQSGNTEQTLNQILVEMDGFEPNQNVIVIAATNRPDVLDPAILRPGRFDRHVTLDYPDFEERKEIILVYIKNKPLAEDFNIDALAKHLVGSSGAEIENTVNEAAIIAVSANRKKITMKDFDDATFKIGLGPEKRRNYDKKTLEWTAYHEAGHALTSKFIEKGEQVHKVSIIPRGQSLGQTVYLPDELKQKTKEDLFAKLVSSVGGYAAEKVVYKETSAGVSGDIRFVTELAKKMVLELGMSDKLGFIKFTEDDDPGRIGFLNKEGYKVSEKTAQVVDSEIKTLVDKAEETAIKVLEKNRDILDGLAKLLLENEVVLGEELDELIKSYGKKPVVVHKVESKKKLKQTKNKK